MPLALGEVHSLQVPYIQMVKRIFTQNRGDAAEKWIGRNFISNTVHSVLLK
jgi:hypothetical protein